MSTPIERFAPTLPMPFSQAVKAGGFVFLSGQLAMDGEGRLIGDDVTTQTRVVLERIRDTLARAGAGMGDVVRVGVWLADLADFAAFNAEYRQHFSEGFPARSTVEARLYAGARVEIEVQAYLGQG
ncbi:MAG: RidA family protein [Burkholderiaceae bacterium]|nr:RidA family protein [Burkholderiaceae bacterium]